MFTFRKKQPSFIKAAALGAFVGVSITALVYALDPTLHVNLSWLVVIPTIALDEVLHLKIASLPKAAQFVALYAVNAAIGIVLFSVLSVLFKIVGPKSKTGIPQGS